MKNPEAIDELKRKETLEYLRNQQKAAEIESKINGINIWVLLGAIGIIVWQLLDTFLIKWWINPEIPLRFLLVTQTIFLLVSFPRVTRPQDEIRLLTSDALSASPVLLYVALVILALPSGLLILFQHSDFGSLTLATVFGIILLICTIELVTTLIDATSKKKRRFPRGSISTTNQALHWFGLIICVFLLVILFKEIIILYRLGPTFDLSLLKNVTLATVLYWLLLFLVLRTIKNVNIDWTYFLETELLLNSVSPHVALRRIEHRQLGSRLAVVMDDFFEDLDEQIEGLDVAIETFKKEGQEIKNVPAEYKDERAARIRKASEPVSERLNRLLDDHEEYVKYMSKLSSRPPNIRRPDVMTAIRHITVKHREIFDKTKALKHKFDSLVNLLTEGDTKSSKASSDVK